MLPDSQKQPDNTYFLEPENAAEMARLIRLDQFTTQAMGGPLTEQSASSTFTSILDMACGPGGWVMDTTHTYPHIEVAGIDISQTMISYASARARAQGLNNASFEVMNILERLHFDDATFDLVNSRLLVGVLLRTTWPAVIREALRVLKPGGVLRMTESDNAGITNSAAHERLREIGMGALRQIGYGFSPDGTSLGITPVLQTLLRDGGLQELQSRAYAINFSAGTEANVDFYHNFQVIFMQLKPVLLKMNCITEEEFEHLYQQTLVDMLSDDFCGVWFFLTVWGKKPL